MGKLIDLTGQKFGRLLVLSRASNKGNHTRWSCQCECGNTTIVQSNNLKSSNTKSCGCLNLDNITKHGYSDTVEYHVWENMKARCYNPNHPEYHRYGARGIKICKQWFNSFENFYKDLGMRPSSKYSLDRIDNNGNYESSNCRWTTAKIQTDNRRNTRYFNNEPLANYCKRTEKNLKTIDWRLRNGWLLEDACKTPIGQRRKKK